MSVINLIQRAVCVIQRLHYNINTTNEAKSKKKYYLDT